MYVSFENTSNVTATKDHHSVPSFKKDLQKLQDELVAQEVFTFKQDRRHKGYALEA